MRDSLYQFLFTGCLDLSPAILSLFTLEVYVVAKNCKNIKTTYFKGSRLSMLIAIKSPSRGSC